MNEIPKECELDFDFNELVTWMKANPNLKLSRSGRRLLQQHYKAIAKRKKREKKG